MCTYSVFETLSHSCVHSILWMNATLGWVPSVHLCGSGTTWHSQSRCVCFEFLSPFWSIRCCRCPIQYHNVQLNKLPSRRFCLCPFVLVYVPFEKALAHASIAVKAHATMVLSKLRLALLLHSHYCMWTLGHQLPIMYLWFFLSRVNVISV